MLRMIARINWAKIRRGVFTTLTYPNRYAGRSADARTYDRTRFLQECERKLGKQCCVIWRCEWEPRKSGTHEGWLFPHFHLMHLNATFLPKEWVRKTWMRIIDEEIRAITWVKGITGSDGVGKYLAKYIAKAPVLDDGAYLNKSDMVGRHWGVSRPSLIPWAPVERDEDITEQEYAEAVAAWKEINPYLGSSPNSSWTVLGEIPKLKFIEKLSERG